MNTYVLVTALMNGQPVASVEWVVELPFQVGLNLFRSEVLSKLPVANSTIMIKTIIRKQ
jgi:hypothetical protein